MLSQEFFTLHFLVLIQKIIDTWCCAVANCNTVQNNLIIEQGKAFFPVFEQLNLVKIKCQMKFLRFLLCSIYNTRICVSKESIGSVEIFDFRFLIRFTF